MSQEFELLGKAIAYITGKVDEIAEAITGSPSDTTKPGILVRLDRLEGAYTRRRRASAFFVGGTVAMVGTIVAALLLRFF